MSASTEEPQTNASAVTTAVWENYSSQTAESAAATALNLTNKVTSSGSIGAAPTATLSNATAQSMQASNSSRFSTLSPITPDRTAGESLQLDRGAIIGATVVGLLLVAILLVSVCLARSQRRRQRSGGDNRASATGVKTPRPAPAGAAGIAREPNPYTNPCFVATNDEMGERLRKTEEPAKSATEGMNSVRNKEHQWIIPLEELADGTMENFDTTKF